jgi:hypothetical protein
MQLKSAKADLTKAARQKRHSEQSMTNAAQVDESSSMSVKAAASRRQSQLKKKKKKNASFNAAQVREGDSMHKSAES